MCSLNSNLCVQDMGHCVRCLATINRKLWVGLADGRIRILGVKSGGALGAVQVGAASPCRPQ